VLSFKQINVLPSVACHVVCPISSRLVDAIMHLIGICLCPAIKPF